MSRRSNASKFKRRVSKNRSRKKVLTLKGPGTRVEEVARGLQVNYREIPYKRLQFRYLDTVNDECLHELIVNDANYASREDIKVAWGIFQMQLKEMW